MKTNAATLKALRLPGTASAHGLARLMGRPAEPLLIADWERTLMLHYEVDPKILRPHVPFPLDLHRGKAYVTLVAFTLRGMRPRWGGRLAAWLMRPIATHDFLNVRTYVRVNGEPGICFLTEFMNNLLSLKLGPLAFALPYRYARINYRHHWEHGHLAGEVTDPHTGATLAYEAPLPDPAFTPATPDTRTEWLMERYTAFNARGTRGRLFRVWHAPWPMMEVRARVHDDSLLRTTAPWFKHARYVGATFSPGVRDVWMGRPHRVESMSIPRPTRRPCHPRPAVRDFPPRPAHGATDPTHFPNTNLNGIGIER